MAQWRGQFSGLTHGTKLADAEATLRAAVAAFRAASPADSAAKAKAVRRLAARVLNLRLKRLKASQRDYGPPSAAIAESQRAASDAGVVGILAEFAAADVQSLDADSDAGIA